MLLFDTPYGSFLLHNATRIDVYITKEEEVWMVYLSIDSHKQVVHGFEVERDALIFTSLLKGEILNSLCEPRGREWKRMRLDDACKAALHKTINQGYPE